MDSHNSSIEQNVRHVPVSGWDAEIKINPLDYQNSSKEEAIEKSSLANTYNISTQIKDPQYEKVLNLMKSAILSGSADKYALAFELYKKVDRTVTILHPTLDRIVLNTKCSDKVLMRHFVSNSEKLKSIATGILDNEAINALNEMQSALKA